MDPEIANVGLSETQATEKGIEIISGAFPMAANGRALQLEQLMAWLK